MRIIALSHAALCLVILSISCSSKPEPTTTYKIENVVKVFSQGFGYYSVMTLNPDTKEIKHIWLGGSITIFADTTDKSWVDVTKTGRECSNVIHLRLDQIDGGRQGGKSIHQTNVVQ